MSTRKTEQGPLRKCQHRLATLPRKLKAVEIQTSGFRAIFCKQWSPKNRTVYSHNFQERLWPSRFSGELNSPVSASQSDHTWTSFQQSLNTGGKKQAPQRWTARPSGACQDEPALGPSCFNLLWAVGTTSWFHGPVSSAPLPIPWQGSIFPDPRLQDLVGPNTVLGTEHPWGFCHSQNRWRVAPIRTPAKLQLRHLSSDMLIP